MDPVNEAMEKYIRESDVYFPEKTIHQITSLSSTYPPVKKIFSNLLEKITNMNDLSKKKYWQEFYVNLGYRLGCCMSYDDEIFLENEECTNLLCLDLYVRFEKRWTERFPDWDL